jgi:hypothetical protein
VTGFGNGRWQRTREKAVVGARLRLEAPSLSFRFALALARILALLIFHCVLLSAITYSTPLPLLIASVFSYIFSRAGMTWKLEFKHEAQRYCESLRGVCLVCGFEAS